MLGDHHTWLCSYSSINRLFTVLSPEVLARRWVTFAPDLSVSDSAGDFTAFTIDKQVADRSELGMHHVKVEIRADDTGYPLKRHTNFNTAILGSPTLFGNRNSGFFWMGQSFEPLWIGGVVPTEWQSASGQF